MVADLRKRFWISLLLTLPVLALSPMIQHSLGGDETWRFGGDAYILVALSSVIYFYGGWPFLDGLRQEVSTRNPGMMTLIERRHHRRLHLQRRHGGRHCRERLFLGTRDAD